MNNKLEENQKPSNVDKSQLAGILFGAGAVWSLVLIIKKSRSLFAWFLPIVLMVIGIEFSWRQHRERVQLTGEQIAAQLDDLDPITRAGVIRYVTDHEIKKLSG
jgi:hypothetical protein